jgi:hypothetical protein
MIGSVVGPTIIGIGRSPADPDERRTHTNLGS